MRVNWFFVFTCSGNAMGFIRKNNTYLYMVRCATDSAGSRAHNDCTSDRPLRPCRDTGPMCGCTFCRTIRSSGSHTLDGRKQLKKISVLNYLVLLKVLLFVFIRNTFEIFIGWNYISIYNGYAHTYISTRFPCMADTYTQIPSMIVD